MEPHYKSDELLVLWGGDFCFTNANYNYQMYDNLIEYMNRHHGDKYEFRYSTPSDYVDAVKKANVTWPVKFDDMFPYEDSPQEVWTGYFTTRPNDKGYTRRASSLGLAAG